MSIYRQKLINAVLFFSKETEHTNLTKLMKLLNFFDFDHFSQTGYPSIGLEYYTFDQGPVPKNFWLEVKDGIAPSDMKDKIKIITKQYDTDKKELSFVPQAKAQVDFSVFSPRERKILEKLAYIYKDCTAKEMSEISHQESLPWEITKKQKGMNEYIDYLLALNEKSPISIEQAKENLADYFTFLSNLDLRPSK